MKTFVTAVLILAALIGATVLNAMATKSTVTEIEEALLQVGSDTTKENAERIKACIAKVEENRSSLHLSFRHTHIDQLVQVLNEALAYCLKGDAPSMNAMIAAATFKVERWKGAEAFTVYNIL